MLSVPADVVVNRYQSSSVLVASCPVIEVPSVSAFADAELLLDSCSVGIKRNHVNLMGIKSSSLSIAI
jgi:hypothetical protein